jgi:hypothetical protein
MKRLTMWLSIVVCLSGLLHGTSAQQARSVKGQVLNSTALPAVQLEFGKEFQYVGSQDFILYGVARAEQHFFVEADAKQNLKRFYWIQFEGYLPDNTNSYRYKANKVVKLGGLDFIADSYVRNLKANASRPDSDGAKAKAFLESKGYRWASDEVLMQRLVHLVDEAKRNELMVIYAEDLQPRGLTAVDLTPNGKAAGQWEEVAAGLLERAQKGMRVRR